MPFRGSRAVRCGYEHAATLLVFVALQILCNTLTLEEVAAAVAKPSRPQLLHRRDGGTSGIPGAAAATGRSRYFSFNAPWQIPAYRRQIERTTAPEKRLELRLRLARELLWDGRSLEAHEELNAISSELAERSRLSQPPTANRRTRNGPRVDCVGRLADG